MNAYLNGSVISVKRRRRVHFSTDQLKRLFNRRIYDRGFNYYLEDRVELHVEESDHLEASVYGTQAYTVEISKNGHGLSFYCSCPYDGPCKHVAATLLEVSNLHDEDSHQMLFDPQLGAPTWQRYFQQLAAPSSARSGAETKWRMLYNVGFRGDTWWLWPRKQKLKKNGDWGKPQTPARTDLAGETWMPDGDQLAIAFLDRWRESSNQFSYYYSYQNRGSRYELDYGAPAGLALTHLRHSDLYLGEAEPDEPLPVHESIGKIEFRLEQAGKGFNFSPYLLLDGRETALSGNFRLLTTEPTWLYYQQALVEIKGNHDASSLTPFMQANYELKIAPEDASAFINGLSRRPKLLEAFRFPKGRTETIDDFKEKRLYLDEEEDGIRIQLKFLYGKTEVDSDEKQPILWDVEAETTKFTRIVRDFNKEAAAYEQLRRGHVKRTAAGAIQTLKNRGLQWLLDDVPVLLAQGFAVFGEEELERFRIRRATPNIRVQLNSGIDWFDLSIEIDIDGIMLSLKELKKALKQKQRYLRLADGSVAALPEAWLKKLRHAINLGEEDKTRVRFSHIHATMIDELFAEQNFRLQDESFADKLEQLRTFKGIETHPLPKSLKAKLRPYQREGYNWLHFLKEFHFGGCLADDMGLGKTVQALSILLSEIENGSDEPNLIVAPTSVVFNWLEEIARFAPSLKVLNQTGVDRQRTEVDTSAYDVVLTSYGTLRNDVLFLKDVQFNYVILDESQNIKNPLSQTAKAVKLLRSRNRLALSGTPMENNTIELWSLFSFLNPGLLGGVSYFKEAFAKPIEKHEDEETANLLRKTIFPFLLRRTKQKVATELPPKVKNVLYAEMSPQQEEVYRRWRDYYRAALLKQIADAGLSKARMNVLEGLTKLRQIACHPLLVEENFAGASTKYELLLHHVDEIRAEGHKVLIFSQFVRMLKIVRAHLDAGNVPYAYLDGATRKRKECVDRFQKDEACGLFLISLKAGGTGLNLTAADYVIHYDPWWNPAVEAQATDRTHRIGQNKHVFVYKMITKNTVEEKIMKLQEKKKGLVEQVVSTDAGLFKKLSAEDIEELFL